MESQVVALGDSQTAVEYLRDRVGVNDVVLIKGSRGMKMDNIVVELEEVI